MGGRNRGGGRVDGKEGWRVNGMDGWREGRWINGCGRVKMEGRERWMDGWLVWMERSHTTRKLTFHFAYISERNPQSFL